MVETLDAFGRRVGIDVAGLAPVALAYDSAGHLEEIVRGTGVDARSTLFEYDAAGRLLRVTDPLLRPIEFDYDAAHRVTTQTLPDGRTIGFGYDANGNLSSLTPPGRPAHVFRYTTVDFEAEYEPPALTGIPDPRTLFSYDLDRRLTRVDRPDGAAFDLAYDAADRLASLSRPAGLTTFDYDAITGNLASVVAPGGEGLAFTYDGMLPTSTTWSGTVAGSVAQTYDDDFRPASQSVNGAHTVAFAYDADSLLVASGALVMARDPDHGLLTDTTLGAVTTAQTYSAFGELASDAAAAGATMLYEDYYARDALGRITQKQETLQGVSTTFDYHYDLAGRLTQVDRGGTPEAIYAYDANGNRLSETTESGTTAGSYDDQDRLVQYGSTTYAFDAAGDLLSKTDTATGETTHYVYDALGNLLQVDLPDGRSIAYAIDGASRRVGKAVNGILVQGFLYGDQLNPVAELDAAGSVVSRFVYGSKPHVPDYLVRGGVTYRILSDHLGSVRLVVDSAAGAIAQRLDYDAFGNVTLDTNPGFQPFGFAGGLYDADTGFVRFGARDYEPVVGRWTVKDPIRFAGGDTNLYGYVLRDPVNFVDPIGLWTFAPEYGTTGSSLSSNMTSQQGAVDQAFNNVASRDAVVTYTTNGAHGNQSFHYNGNAVDLRTRDLTPAQIQQVADQLQDALGPNYQVVIEGDHIHIEYDPPGGPPPPDAPGDTPGDCP